MRNWLIVSGLALLLDQISKFAAFTLLHQLEPVSVIPFVDLSLTFNRGAAFSFLSNAGGWQRWFFIALAFLVCVYILFLLSRIGTNEKLQGAGLSLILGGALGNLVDRLHLGHVIDFIDVYYGQAHFPTFNIADSAITVGAGLILLDMLRQHRHSVSNEN